MTSFTFGVIPAGQGSVGVTLLASTVTDLAGNGILAYSASSVGHA
jgi:hypothetical protein